jgi:hypothetical protein
MLLLLLKVIFILICHPCPRHCTVNKTTAALPRQPKQTEAIATPI